ncbi:hypothetical protein SteCoe_11975 [Stentor coeruleus]|uniref:Uncharacterized protein n=1 Tax=Stentor coeruleus TaxID=5963 RepID=A0A1R2CBX3_9CILI|nr:hypothetical protein SteCoe_11975 [Stentor coeruleus]
MMQKRHGRLITKTSNNISESPHYRLSPLNFIKEFTPEIGIKSVYGISPRPHKKIKAKDLVFAARSQKEGTDIGIIYETGIKASKRFGSHKILPPLKPTLHISNHSPRYLPIIESSSQALTVTFSSREFAKNNIFYSP